jgi:squalene-hopene/tetraprenyl-beta-curcumene cyclase
MNSASSIAAALRHTGQHLLNERCAQGHWRGELSSSALSTATAVCALSAFLESSACSAEITHSIQELCERGIHWLVENQNADGGWGDTTKSFSNISTTALCWAAFAGKDQLHRKTVEACAAWLQRAVAGASADPQRTLEPTTLAAAVRASYGKDHTFSVPILTVLTLSGRFGPEPQAWKLVPQLPFELAAFPHAWYAKLKLPVVSYALPALIAIGLVRFTRADSWNLPLKFLRRLVKARTLRVLEEIQPSSGGYLEAIPLTSFVCVSLIRANLASHPVVARGLRFLRDSIRPDGSWAIDSDLSLWTTTLSIGAIGESGLVELCSNEERQQLRDWILSTQFQTEHPYTHAAPGGWAWTDLPGGVPDADDTPGAILALACLDDHSERVLTAASRGVEWLLDLQNSDGGIPTFCRGWGKLPFDRSSADLTAHTIRAWLCWDTRLTPALHTRIQLATEHGLRFLAKIQRHDGAWSPLWFGNQHTTELQNLVYGTSRVLLAGVAVAAKSSSSEFVQVHCQSAWKWLLDCRNPDGGWGGAPQTPTSIEETALALDALTAGLENTETFPWLQAELRERSLNAIECGVARLLELNDHGHRFPPTPIGFYFANLWYFEKLYPVIFTLTALRRASKLNEVTRVAGSAL